MYTNTVLLVNSLLTGSGLAILKLLCVCTGADPVSKYVHLFLALGRGSPRKAWSILKCQMVRKCSQAGGNVLKEPPVAKAGTICVTK